MDKEQMNRQAVLASGNVCPECNRVFDDTHSMATHYGMKHEYSKGKPHTKQ